MRCIGGVQRKRERRRSRRNIAGPKEPRELWPDPGRWSTVTIPFITNTTNQKVRAHTHTARAHTHIYE